MKITKKTTKDVKASEEIVDVIVDPAATAAEVVPAPSCKYDCAINFISSAIECLAEIARDDQIAKDSIANLGVVMLDLKGACV